MPALVIAPKQQSFSGDSKTENKTPSKSSTEQNKIPIAGKTLGSNILNNYKSYTYNFTLASLKGNALVNPFNLDDNQDYWIIARSGGKGTTGLQNPIQRTAPTSQLYTNPNSTQAKHNQNVIAEINRLNESFSSLLQNFNTQSPGQFDFYIDQVEIENIVGGDKKTSMSPATNIKFQITEPYSMSGFIEALHVSAIASGHDSYINCPYMLKMQFIGYPDGPDLSDPEIIDKSTRYFPMKFTSIDIEVKESGTVYNCSAVPWNEQALGEVQNLKDTVQIKGSVIKDILTSFMDGINTGKLKEAQALNNSQGNVSHDIFEIVFPTPTDTGLDYTKDNEIAGKKLVELYKSNTAYEFIDQSKVTDNNNTDTIPYDPVNPIAQFAKGQDVVDCISSVIRDSEYVKNIAETFKIDENGMVDYFMVNVETEHLGIDNPKTNLPLFKYRYVVVPYKIHYSRFPPKVPATADTSKLKESIHREYNYIYSGKNVDITGFRLQFNTLFFSAIPKALGNNVGVPSNGGLTEQSGSSKTALPDSKLADREKSWLGKPPIKVATDNTMVVVSGVPNTALPTTDPYADLAKSMHKAILENVDQCTAELNIIGDPYYLVTDNIGNQRHTKNPDGTVGQDEAPFIHGDVHIVINFKNPLDIDPTTGEAIFQSVADSKTGKSVYTAKYSGVFRVTQIVNYFKDGKFTQKLDLIRLTAQVEDTDVPPPTKLPLPVIEYPDPVRENINPPPDTPSTVRATEDTLAAEIASSLSLNGLPGDLSNLLPGNLQSISGSPTGGLSIGSFINSLSSGASGINGSLINRLSGSSALGLLNVASAIRLTNSGLTNFSTNINSAGGSVNQLSNVANSIGFNNVSPNTIAQNAIASGANSSNLSSSALSQVNNLGNNAAGLVSSNSAQLSNINGNVNSLESTLGINPNRLAGLSGGLRSKIYNTIIQAAQNVPKNVDINAAVSNGLLINNIPVQGLKNIPSTQPTISAPDADINISDVRYILKNGGTLSDIPGAASIPNINKLISNNKASVVAGSALSPIAVSGKVSTLQSGFSQLTGNSPSVEAVVNTINSVVPTGLPNVSNVSPSVVSKYGSKSASAASSPLINLINGSNKK